MALSQWQPGVIYIPGSLVIPTSVPGASPTIIPNHDFESGDSDWTKGTGWAINTNLAFEGTQSAEYSGPGVAKIVSSTKHAVTPGKSITAQCFIHQGASDDGEANAAVILEWYDSGSSLIATSTGNVISTGAVGIWRKSTVSAVAPPLAAEVSIGATSNNDFAALNADKFSWNYVTGAAASAVAFKAIGRTTEEHTDIAFVDSNPDTITMGSGSFIADGFTRAKIATISGSASNDGEITIDVLAAGVITLPAGEALVVEGAGAAVTISLVAEAGTSGQSEPSWPSSVGQTVVDGGVTWEVVAVDSVTWEASSVLTSGSSEPTWPTEANAFVSDNNIAWESTPLRIEDPNCPHTKVVAIAASKVFAGDVDKVRFCATLNARDWTTADDAGFLPSGQQQKSQVGVSGMGVYRGNLAIWSPSTFQVWQVDPDPASMALLDAMEGIGTSHQQAVQPVADELFFLAALGVRTVSIAEGSNNLASGDVGVPIDILVQAEVGVDVEPVASYYPGAGQFWLAFRPITIAAAILAGQFLLTSPIYPIEVEDAIISNTAPVRGRLTGYSYEEAISGDNAPDVGLLGGTIVEYEYEEAIENDTLPSLGTLGGGIVEYDYEEAIEGGNSPSFGTLDGALITYENYEDAIINDTLPKDSTLV